MITFDMVLRAMLNVLALLLGIMVCMLLIHVAFIWLTHQRSADFLQANACEEEKGTWDYDARECR